MRWSRLCALCGEQQQAVPAARKRPPRRAPTPEEEIGFPFSFARVRTLMGLVGVLGSLGVVLSYETPIEWSHRPHAMEGLQNRLALVWKSFWYDPRVDGPEPPTLESVRHEAKQKQLERISKAWEQDAAAREADVSLEEILRRANRVAVNRDEEEE